MGVWNTQWTWLRWFLVTLVGLCSPGNSWSEVRQNAVWNFTCGSNGASPTLRLTHACSCLTLTMCWGLWEEPAAEPLRSELGEKCQCTLFLASVCVQTCWRSQTSGWSSSSSTRWGTTCSTPVMRWRRSTTTPSLTWLSVETASATATPQSAPQSKELRLELKAWYVEQSI